MTEPMLPVVILAGGLGTRLRPLTETIPKALAPVAGEPFLAHQLRLLSRRGVRRVVLLIGYLGEMVREFAGDGSGFGLSIDYCQDWPDLRGTAGAVKQALPLLPDRFFVLYGDSYLPCDYHAVQRCFLAGEKPGLMTVYANRGQWDTSNVEFANGRIVTYDKQRVNPRMHHIDYGLGAFRREVFASLDEGKHDLAAVYGHLLAKGALAAIEVDQRFYEIGSEQGIRDLEAYLEKHS